MRFIKRLFASKEVRAALGVLEEALYTFSAEDPFRATACDLVRPRVENSMLGRRSDFAKFVQKGMSPREYVYSESANVAGDLLESGEYNLYRRLSPLGPGKDLYQLFCGAVDELVRIGTMSPDFAEGQKGALARNIRDAG